MKRLQFCLVVFALLALAGSAFAQVQNGQFTGTVIDPTGAAIANAKVTVTNLATNLSAATATNQNGIYTVRELPVGTYKLTVEAPGFKTLSNTDVALNAGTIAHVDFKMTLGQTREVIEVSTAAAAVNTEDSKLASVVTSDQVQNLPLNGRNIYDLIQLAPGAVNVRGVVSENGANTVVNGLREDFNGFLINGVSNKGLSGGAVTQPVEDTVQEFQELTLNMSAQYGNSAGSVTNLVTKSGSNAFHGSGWEFNRNDAYDANSFGLNQQGVKRQPIRYNQFGGTIGGPILKDKLFFFLSYQGNHFRESAPPTNVTAESPDWRNAVISALSNSTAALLYKNFTPTVTGSVATNLNDYVPATCDPADPKCSTKRAVPASVVPIGTPIFSGYLCPDKSNSTIAAKLATVVGVTATDQAIMNFQGCSATPGITAGSFTRTLPFEMNTVAFNGSQNQNNVNEGNLFNGWETSGRIDYNFSSKDRLFFQLNWNRLTDSFGFPNTVSNSNGRGPGFLNPVLQKSPNGQLSYIHTFSPTVLNELRLGYTLNIALGDVSVATPGVPDIRFDDGSMGFGSYAGYPQTFHENIYTYSDMVSIAHGKHSMKMGVDFRRNIENSEFNVSRSSYYFADPLFFAADSPETQTAGVDPGILTGQTAHLASNFRHWRNLEMGAYFQDDWKVTRNLTLNLGLRYDLYTRHNELNNKVTTFIKGPGSNITDQILNASVPAGTSGTIGGQAFDCTSQASIAVAQLAPASVPTGVAPCGPGGFTSAKSLGAGDHNNFGPRVGFAWDIFGNGKTSMRGGFGISYEGTLYNPLSNSRWNLPFYSFNSATGPLVGGTNTVMYGPFTCPDPATRVACQPDPTATPTFTGPPTNPNMGVGAQATGNLTGWDPSNPNTAFLTGIVFPEGIKDPYVYNFFLGLQREIMPKLVVEANYTGTAGHKLFRAQNVNRVAGAQLPVGVCTTDNLGRHICGTTDLTPGAEGSGISAINPNGVLNPNFGTLRVWENVVNSNYSALQLSARKQASHGMSFNLNYTWSHAIDDGSTWHSGSTSSNGPAAGEGYTTDVSLPGLDRGNSIFDIRQRFVASYLWEIPWYQSQHGAIGHILGGWSLNGIISRQTGAHWSPFVRKFANVTNAAGDPCTQADVDSGNCTNTGGDFNLDFERNDRPNAQANNIHATHDQWANGFGPGFAFDLGNGSSPNGFFTAPCLGCVATLGRNTFVGPSFVSWETSLHKKIRITERVGLEFRAEAFNVLNHTNFQLPGAHNATNNRITQDNFGQAGTTFNPRQMQLGLKISF